MRFLSVCSGIEAASMAWNRRGWQAVAFSEIDPFASAVLAERHPDVPNWGDMTKFEEWPDADVDVLVGGTPCQSFSVAGLRKGLDDQRGNLMLVYAAIARKYRPKWVVWENVPGVLSDDGGRGFGSLLGILSGKRVEAPAGGWESAGTVPGIESAYGLAWRVLDAQFVRVDTHARAVPQRRKRVFVVGCLGDWRRSAAVLFERDSLSGNPAPRREAGKRVAPTVEARANAGGAGWGTDFLAGGLAADCEVPLNAIDGASHAVCAARMVGGASEVHGETFIGAPIAFGGNNTAGPIDVATACRAKGGSGHGDFESETFVAEVAEVYALRSDAGRDGQAKTPSPDAEGRVRLRDPGFNWSEGVAPTLDASQPHTVAYASHFTRGKDGAPSPVAPALSADADKGDQDTLVLAFDETQITNPENRCQPKPGDPSHPLAAGARPPTICFSAKDSGGDAMDECAPTLRAGHHIDGNANAGVMPAIADAIQAGALRENPDSGPDGVGVQDGAAYTLEARAEVQAVAFDCKAGAKTGFAIGEVPGALRGDGHGGGHAAVMLPTNWRVRRLTPLECARLQGFPDGYLDITYRGKPAADGPKYRALGNAMAVNCMAWIGQRIELVAAL